MIGMRRRVCVLIAVIAGLLAGAGCRVTTAPAARPPAASLAPAAGPLWNGTDLLWDAIGTARGFTAVGNSGVVVTSADGGQWHRQPAATRQTLRGVTSADGTVVAVGTGGTILRWPEASPARAVLVPSGVDIPLLGVAHGTGTWVVGGSSGAILASHDLAHWSRATTPVDGDVFAIAYGAGHFVAVTDIGGVITSTDGMQWTTTRAADGLWLWGAAYGRNGFLISGANGTILRSTDGLSWTERPTGTTQVLRGVGAGPGGYLAVGSDATVLSSPDGLTWTPHRAGDPGVELWRPAASPRGWLAVGAGGTRPVSTDLASWSGSSTTRDAFYGAGARAGEILAAGVDGTVARREAAGSWTTVETAPGRRELRSVGYAASTWLATGGGGTILTSTDGTHWVPRTSTSKAELWSAAAINSPAGQPRLVVVGAGGAILVSDDRGATWIPAPDPQTATLFSVASGPQGLVAVGVDGAIVRSADGLRWDVVRRGQDGTGVRGQTLRAVAADASYFVAVGATGTVLISTDGAIWRTARPATDVTLRAVAKIGPSEWAAVGGGGVILRSSDAQHWERVASGTDSELFGVTSESPTSCNAIAVAGVDAVVTTSDCGASWR
jgi:hypothetical protein